MFFTTIGLAIRSIARHKLRSFLTTLGIIIGVAAVVTMVTLGKATTAAVQQSIASLGTNILQVRPGQGFGRGGGGPRPPDFKNADVNAIRQQIPGVTAVAPQAQATGTAIYEGANWSTTVNGTTTVTSTNSGISDSLAQSAIGSILGSSGGFGGFAANLGRDGIFGAIINAVKADTTSNLLQSPHVVVLDNVPARILVGQEIPVTTGEALGVACRPVRNAEMLAARLADSPARAVAVDLTSEHCWALMDLLRGAAATDQARALKVLCFGPHGDVDALRKAGEMGANAVMSFGQFSGHHRPLNKSARG